MRDITPETITSAFARYAERAPSARARELLVALAGHLHGFVRDHRVTHGEWQAAVSALTRAAAITDADRNEFILFSDLLGVSSLVDMVNARADATSSSVLRPFHVEAAPPLPDGGDLWRGQAGEPLVVVGQVADDAGRGVAGCVLDLWQTAGNGLYAQQDPAQPAMNYHARLACAADGSFALTTVRPMPYTVPDDGPAGDMLRALGREAWRPAHLHIIARAPGFAPLVTELFPADDPWLDRDAVFGVRADLVLPFERMRDARQLPAHLVARDRLPSAFWVVRPELTLARV